MNFNDVEIIEYNGKYTINPYITRKQFAASLEANPPFEVGVFDSALEAIEDYARNNGLISSEIELSHLFDTKLIPAHPPEWWDVRDYNQFQRNTFTRLFDSWKKELYLHGLLHPVQKEAYKYIGEDTYVASLEPTNLIQ